MELLNRIVLGGNAGTFPERGFYAVDKSKLGNPDYDPQFFEAFPSLWANAYAFQKAVEPPRRRDPVAVEEWGVLFFLHFFGVLHLETYDSEKIIQEYDGDLWTAINGTYLDHELPAVKLLKTSDGVVVGGYYPKVVFFPSRGRSAWRSSKSLLLYLKEEETRLSWQKCMKNLRPDQAAINRFYARLRAIAQAALEGDIRDALVSFIQTEPLFEHAYWELEELKLDPGLWPPYDEPTPEKLLKDYPLQKTHDGKRTFYLVSGFPYPSDWMAAPIGKGMPAPLDYTKANDSALHVDFSGRSIMCSLSDGDRIVFLRDLFLSDPTYACVLDNQTSGRVPMSVAFHKITVLDGKGDFAQRNKGKVVVSLAPIRREFLHEFPEILSEPNKSVKSRIFVERDKPEVEWFLNIKDREIRWSSKLDEKPKLPASLVSVWPPKVSRDWRLYVARGIGSKEDTGRWTLIDENGQAAVIYELEENEYVAVLNDTSKANRPRAMLVNDPKGGERGVLFLKPLEDATIGQLRKATLSVDFGTSNTCMVHKVHGIERERPEPVIFNLKPLILWGEIPERLELGPGFAPFDWGGEKGFFPTVLFVRRASTDLANVKLEQLELKHLFQVAIPGLHRGLKDREYLDQNQGIWEPHVDLKWELRPQSPYRLLFLWLSLVYAHAEVFFRYDAAVEDYVFTYPLALPNPQRKHFHTEAKSAIRNARRHCYGRTDPDNIDDHYREIDESSAIARSAFAAGNPQSVEVFIDLGGGTADIAVRHHAEYLMLDSIRLAGMTFFKFAERNFPRRNERERDIDGASEFRQRLALLLQNEEKELAIEDMREDIPLGTFYALTVNHLDDREFAKREEMVLHRGMGKVSYQRYRAQSLFRHVIAYALLQACAAIVNGKISLSTGITIVLGGNAWALLMFAGFRRSNSILKKETRDILDLLKKHLKANLSKDPEYKDRVPYIEQLNVFDLKLLNENQISEAKIALARGALLLAQTDRRANDGDQEEQAPFTGITFDTVRVNGLEPPVKIRWFDRWRFEDLAEIVNKKRREDQRGDSGKTESGDVLGLNTIQSLKIEYPDRAGNGVRALDPVLEAFAQICNAQNFGADQLEEQEWHEINSRLIEGGEYLDERPQPRYAPVNVFLSKILYSEDEGQRYMDLLAELNLNPKTKPETKMKSKEVEEKGKKSGEERDRSHVEGYGA